MITDKTKNYEKAWKSAIGNLDDSQAEKLLLVLLQAEKYKPSKKGCN